MIIAVCILGVLLLCAIWIILALWYALNIVLDKYIKSNPKNFIEYYFDKQAEEIFPCTLLFTENNNADFTGLVYDFSQYEEKNIIGLIECKNESVPEDYEPKFALIPNQTVLRMKDGNFQWDFRGLM